MYSPQNNGFSAVIQTPLKNEHTSPGISCDHNALFDTGMLHGRRNLKVPISSLAKRIFEYLLAHENGG